MTKSFSRRAWLACVLAAGLLPAALTATERGPARPVTAVASSTESARVIVRFKAGSATARALSASGTSTGPRQASALGARTGLGLSDGRALDARTQVLSGSGLSSAALAKRLAADSEVEWAVVDQRRQRAAAPNDPLYASASSPAVGQWYLRAPSVAVKSSLDIETAWGVTQGLSSLVVAVLDTGVRTTHPDLASKLLSGYDFISDVPTANDGDGRDSDPADPGDWITSAEDASGTFAGCGAGDSSWHGTQVAGLIGAATNNGVGMAGVAPNVMLLPVRVLGKCGGYDSDIIAGMRWAAGLSVPGVTTNPHPARVLNLSLGSEGSCTSAYQSAITELTNLGVAVVVAAGNDGLAVGVPANCSGAIAVAGVRHTGTKVGYSSLGPEATIAAPAGNCVNASGECLYPMVSTANTGTTSPVSDTYTTGGADAALGTSFSAPLVSGTVALMLSYKPALTNDQVISTLKATATAFPSTGADSGVSTCRAPSSTAQTSECYCTTSTCGAGLLNAGAALTALAGASNGVAPVISASSSSAVAGATLQLDGSASQVGTGRSIAGYAWQITAGSSLASITGSATAASVTLDTFGAGSVTVQLTVTDDLGHTGSATQTVTVSASALTPVITVSNAAPVAGSTVTLDSSSSLLDSGRSVVSRQWTLLSGSGFASFQGSTTGSSLSLLTSATGTVVVQLTLTDSEGLSASSTRSLVISGVTPQASISVAATATKVGESLTLSASASTPGTAQTLASYQWRIVSGGAYASFTGPTNGASATLTGTAAGSVLVQLTVTDTAGVSASTSQSITIAAASSGDGGGAAGSPVWALLLLLLTLALPATPRRRD